MTTLAELREQSLKEQKADAENHSVDAEVRKSASTDLRKRVRTEVLAEGSTEVRADSSAEARADLPKHAPKQVRKESEPKGEFLDRVREGIAQKKVHPGGVKATVDMAPELSLRAKRYCLDHGNVPVRQVFLELLSAFLEEEGY